MGRSFVTYMKAEGAADYCLNCPMETKERVAARKGLDRHNERFLLISSSLSQNQIVCARLMKGFVSRLREFSNYPTLTPSTQIRSLFRTQLNSLMALDLRRRLAERRRSDEHLPATLAFNYPNLSALIDSPR